MSGTKKRNVSHVITWLQYKVTSRYLALRKAGASQLNLSYCYFSLEHNRQKSLGRHIEFRIGTSRVGLPCISTFAVVGTKMTALLRGTDSAPNICTYTSFPFRM